MRVCVFLGVFLHHKWTGESATVIGVSCCVSVAGEKGGKRQDVKATEGCSPVYLAELLK